MSKSHCPSRANLLAYQRGELEEAVAERLIQHLGSCEVCQDTVRGLSAAEDTFLSRLRRPARLDEYAHEPERDQLIRRAKAMAVGDIEATFDSHATSNETPAERSELKLGRLGEYVLLEKLGQGGMGTVYKALQTKLEKLVALKVLSDSRMEDEAAVSRFEREMKAIGRLSDPHVVQAFDARVIDGRYVLVMEYVEGIDLSELVSRCGPLPVAEACELIRRAALGFQYAHENGLVHRDVKPSNLMLAKEGQVKVLDLGLALLHDPRDEDAQELTTTGQMMGTLDYMAPEQSDDSHQVDIRADIYSLGATLFKLLSGGAPFSGAKYGTPAKKLRALVSQEVPSILDRRSEVPRELATLIGQMTAKSPDRRPATPGELAAALEPFCAGADLRNLLAQATGEPVGPVSQKTGTGSTDRAALAVSEDTRPSESPATAPTVPAAKSAKRAVVATGQPFHGRPWTPRLVTTVTALGTIVLLGAILAIQMSRGVLVIDVPDGEQSRAIKVAVLSDGEEVCVVDRNDNWKIRLKGGQYHFELRGGNERFELKDNRLTVTRFGRTVLTIIQKEADGDGKRAELATAPGTSDQSEEPVALPTASGRQKAAHPADEAFVAAVNQLEADEQIEAVARRMKELNPRFDDKLEHKIENGKVVCLKFCSDEITDVSPVAALMHLVELDCSGGHGEWPSTLRDLGPLAHLRLARFRCEDTAVVDFAPLAGMPLEAVWMDLGLYNKEGTRVLRSMESLQKLNDRPVAEYWGTHVALRTEIEEAGKRFEAVHRGLGPERAVQLQREFVTAKLRQLNPDFDGQLQLTTEDGRLIGLQLVVDRVTDIAPVRALPHLRWLKCTGSRYDDERQRASGRLADLAPFTSMPLSDLDCSLTRVNDLAPLAGMKLVRLACQWTLVSDLSPLKGMPLKWLWCDNTQIADLAPLKGMPLEDLNCGATQIADLGPLKGMALSHLNCGNTRVSGLSPLHGMPLNVLICGDTAVSDLGPLQGMKLTELRCAQTGVSDLSPLAGMPLTTLNCGLTAVSDLSPLRGMQLTELDCSNTRVRDLSVATAMPLQVLGYRNTQVHDFPVEPGGPLRVLRCNLRLFDAAQNRLLKSLSLEFIGYEPADQVLKQMEDRRRQWEAFVRSVAEHPVRQRLEDVHKELQQLERDIDITLSHTIKGDSVQELGLDGFPRDLAPLRALTRLRKLTLAGAAPIDVDLSALGSLPLEELTCDEGHLRANGSVLRSIDTLETINGQSASAFWRRAVKYEEPDGR